MEKAKRIPYGVSNFVDVVERNQYYVDKTMYLPFREEHILEYAACVLRPVAKG